MAFLDFLIGRNNLDRMQDAGDEFAKSQYDPSQIDPAIASARDTAMKGIDDANLREQVMGDIYKQTPNTQTGTSQGSQLAAFMTIDEARSGAMAEASGSIGIADEQTKAQGRQQVGSLLSEREKLKRTREAAIAENRLMIESEAGARKQKLLGAAVNLASAGISGGGTGMLDFISNYRSQKQSEVDRDYNNPNAGVWGTN